MPMLESAPRRRLLALLAATLATGVLPGWARAALPPALPQALPGVSWQRWGQAVLRRFGFKVYEATLWAGSNDPLQLPYALELHYAIDIPGERLASVSINEMRRLDRGSAQQHALWSARLKTLFPDVRAGERIIGMHLPDGARFYHQNRLLGVVEDPEFAKAFFAIWLDPASDAPEVRAALLRRPEGA